MAMNPALDIATATQRVEPAHKLRCTEPRYDPGGGINLARSACVGRRSSRDLIRPRGRERDDNKLGVRSYTIRGCRNQRCPPVAELPPEPGISKQTRGMEQ